MRNPLQLALTLGIVVAAASVTTGCIFPEEEGLSGPGTSTAGGDDDGLGDGLDETGAEPPAEPFEHRYFMAQYLEYDGEGAFAEGVPEHCQNIDAPYDIVSELRAALAHDGWTGSYARDRERYPEAELHAIPEMFAEASSVEPFSDNFVAASDSEHADAYDMVMFAGHGRQGLIEGNVPRDADPDASCGVEFETDIRLGAFCGQTAKLGIFATPCAMGFDQEICPPPPVDGDGDPFNPWPDECWNSLDCTMLKSRLSFSLGFKDVPTISPNMITEWYEATAHMRLSDAWISWMITDDTSSSLNQPAVVFMADDYDQLVDRYYDGDLRTGEGLSSVDPDAVSPGKGLWYVSWSGDTGLVHSDGTPVQYMAQDPETNPSCLPDPGIVCGDQNPAGALLSDCIE